ncbi:hypothetical protein N657DRAFT_368211 [Parathielavia appendiculata]|uniref:Uncharacterized protein n=1 Tax=Parathielavia appendiculata TaxID=2587402 RepID=A0AAN6YYT9_9PEZI|nr:hypothetical protein N657DRAFT_368211 [Parathielavia appendiculata]
MHPRWKSTHVWHLEARIRLHRIGTRITGNMDLIAESWAQLNPGNSRPPTRSAHAGCQRWHLSRVSGSEHESEMELRDDTPSWAGDMPRAGREQLNQGHLACGRGVAARTVCGGSILTVKLVNVGGRLEKGRGLLFVRDVLVLYRYNVQVHR